MTDMTLILLTVIVTDQSVVLADGLSLIIAVSQHVTGYQQKDSSVTLLCSHRIWEGRMNTRAEFRNDSWKESIAF